MLIDTFSPDWLDDLYLRAEKVALPARQYILIDGAFVPGLHRMLASERKAVLFAALPGCTAEAADASPFLTLLEPGDRGMKKLLRRCERWPMVSVIETRESLAQLAGRLSAWCVVEVDSQRFNFRFPDTRRLPAIVDTLNPAQRAQFLGPASRWTYVARDGRWHALPVEGSDAGIADNPELDERQFATLAGDSHADELAVLLGDRGHEVYERPSRTHALLRCALLAAQTAGMDDHELTGWCEWFWQQDRLCENADAADMLHAWRTTLV